MDKISLQQLNIKWGLTGENIFSFSETWWSVFPGNASHYRASSNETAFENIPTKKDTRLKIESFYTHFLLKFL
jgi:hypothetical protein